MKTAIDFPTPVRREAARVASVISFVDAPEFCRSEYWFVRIAYRVESALLFFDCETDRHFGVDVVFGPSSKKEARHSFHTFLRLFDSPVASGLGSSLPKDQHDMDDLLRLYSDALVKHRQAIFRQTEESIAAMERAFKERDFANQPFRPGGRFV
jgi:hypothetical protein